MSVRVELAELQQQLNNFGSTPYLVTTSTDLRPHTTHVIVSLDGGYLNAIVGRKTATNITDRALVSLLFMPVEPGGFTLIVDGIGSVGTTDDVHAVSINVTAAVLHRNADPDGGYRADCTPLDGRS